MATIANIIVVEPDFKHAKQAMQVLTMIHAHLEVQPIVHVVETAEEATHRIAADDRSILLNGIEDVRGYADLMLMSQVREVREALRKMERIEGKLDRIADVLYGNEASGRDGIKQQVRDNVARLKVVMGVLIIVGTALAGALWKLILMG